jgi:hypothetical protein
MSWLDSAIAFNKDEFFRIESTLIIKYDRPWTEDFLWAHGTNAREVFQAAREAGAKVPFIEQILPIDDVPFGGW